MSLLGVGMLWKGRMSFLYHTPIYERGSFMYSWQAFIAGGLCLAVGLYLACSAIRKGRKPGGDA
jgi:hypothetical protein